MFCGENLEEKLQKIPQEILCLIFRKMRFVTFQEVFNLRKINRKFDRAMRDTYHLDHANYETFIEVSPAVLMETRLRDYRTAIRLQASDKYFKSIKHNYTSDLSLHSSYSMPYHNWYFSILHYCNYKYLLNKFGTKKFLMTKCGKEKNRYEISSVNFSLKFKFRDYIKVFLDLSELRGGVETHEPNGIVVKDIWGNNIFIRYYCFSDMGKSGKYRTIDGTFAISKFELTPLMRSTYKGEFPIDAIDVFLVRNLYRRMIVYKKPK